MNKTATVVLFIALSSCSLSSEFRKRSFDVKGADSFALLVPKNWSRSTVTQDSAGGNMQVYHYADGASLYITDAGRPFRADELIDTARHIPLPVLGGGTMYKGVMPGLLYWREIQRGAYRFGYRNVITERENSFDSALNYAVQMRPVR